MTKNFLVMTNQQELCNIQQECKAQKINKIELSIYLYMTAIELNNKNYEHSIGELAKTFNKKKITIRKSLRNLQSKGWIAL